VRQYEQLSPEEAARIDAACDRFEQAWKAVQAEGTAPCIATYLEGCPESERMILARELIALDRACRQRYGLPVRAEEYEEISATALIPAGSDVPLEARGSADARRVANWPRLPGLELEKLLGSGGMGVVFKARQPKLGRDVAVKMLRDADLASSEQHDRFVREAQAVARLQHPHLVQLYEFGEAPASDGSTSQPYLVLEYVGGESLADLVKGSPLPPREAARLVQMLAQAIHYAHLQGVIHRDLKPANVLLQKDEAVRMKDEKITESFSDTSLSTAGVHATRLAVPLLSFIPKITDFGLAKFGAGTKLTRTGDVLGTPSYMAPEQAMGKSGVITRAVDVYGLGAVLYEALTGRPPFTAETEMATLAQVLEVDPVPPRRLQPTVPRDLETICLKCLRKEAVRRYATAQELADDLGRFLAGESIHGRPVGRSERVVRWCRRKPVLAGLLAAVILALASGAAGMVWQWQRAEAKAAEARQAQELAEANYAKIRETIDRMAQHGEDLSYKLEGQALLQEALAAYQVLLREKGDDPTVNLRKAQAQLRSGEIRFWLRQQQEAASDNRQARDLLNRLDSSDRAVRRLLARSYALEGQLLGWWFYTLKLAEGESALYRAIELQEPLHAAEPHNTELAIELLDSLLNLSEMLCWQGRGHDAKPIHERTLALLQPLFDAAPKEPRYLQRMAHHLGNLGLLRRVSGQGDEAEKFYAQALDLCRRWHEVEPGKPHARHWQSHYLSKLAELREQAGGRTKEAERSFREVIELRKALVDGFPNMPRYHELLASALGDLSRLLRNSGRCADALATAHESVAVAVKAVAQWPKYNEARWALGRNHHRVALTLEKLGKPKDALPEYQAALDQFEKLASEFPDEPEYLRQQAPVTFAIGQLHMANKNYAAAQEAYRKTLALNDRLVTQFKGQPIDRFNKAWDLSHLSEAYEAAGRLAEAKEYLKQSIEEFRRLAADFPKESRYRDDLGSRRAEQLRLSFKPWP
jgi:serine/threonine protein kinase/tetratricopeptide (TPR) repeat protein